jgi:hypothetical protein
MKNDLYKFGWQPDRHSEEERYLYKNDWAKEKTTGPDRVVIAPRSQQIELIQQLVGCLEEPFDVLYVLVVSRGEGNPGRYESKSSFSATELRTFLDSYSDFFEQDARQNLWIRSASSNGFLIHDRHNVIYAYGPLEQFFAVLESAGLTESNDVYMRGPHTHRYHEEFDSDAKRILMEVSWNLSPLRPGDENPD